MASKVHSDVHPIGGMSLVVVALLGLLHRNTVSFHEEESRGGIQSSFRRSPIADVSLVAAALLNLLHRNTGLVSLDCGERTGERVGDSNWRHVVCNSFAQSPP
eukprot:scaffold33704_cov224-Skeletonema_dohrnii-CCMP3373.AAC.1